MRIMSFVQWDEACSLTDDGPGGTERGAVPPGLWSPGAVGAAPGPFFLYLQWSR